MAAIVARFEIIRKSLPSNGAKREQNVIHAEFEGHTTVFIKISICWDIIPYSQLENNQHFGGI
jgi:hypothetical protein